MNADAVSSLTASVKSNYCMFSLTVSHTHTLWLRSWFNARQLGCSHCLQKRNSMPVLDTLWLTTLSQIVLRIMCWCCSLHFQLHTPAWMCWILKIHS